MSKMKKTICSNHFIFQLSTISPFAQITFEWRNEVFRRNKYTCFHWIDAGANETVRRTPAFVVVASIAWTLNTWQSLHAQPLSPSRSDIMLFNRSEAVAAPANSSHTHTRAPAHTHIHDRNTHALIVYPNVAWYCTFWYYKNPFCCQK